MTKHEIDGLKIGSLIKYHTAPSDDNPDIGLLNKVITRGDVVLYCFLWTGHTGVAQQPSTETAHSLNVAKFVLVQHAEC